MSTELCRRSGALPNFLRLRRPAYQRSFKDSTFWEGRINSSFADGEPFSSRAHLSSEDDTSAHMQEAQSPRVTVTERIVYSKGWGGPSTIAEVLRRKGMLQPYRIALSSNL